MQPKSSHCERRPVPSGGSIYRLIIISEKIRDADVGHNDRHGCGSELLKLRIYEKYSSALPFRFFKIKLLISNINNNYIHA